MRTAKIGWVTSLLIASAAVVLSGCLTKEKRVNVPYPTTTTVAGPTTTVSGPTITLPPVMTTVSVKLPPVMTTVSVKLPPVMTTVTTAAPNKAQTLLAVTDYGTDTSRVEVAVESDGVFHFGNRALAVSGNEAYDNPSMFVSQSSKDHKVNVKFGKDINSVQFLDNSLASDITTDSGGQTTAITYRETVDFSVPLSRLTSSNSVFTDSKKASEYGRKGTRYNVLHAKEDGNAIVLFATDSKYLKDYDSDDANAEMFSGGYWVEISEDSDGSPEVVNAGVYSDAKSLKRSRDQAGDLVWAGFPAEFADTGTEITATYAGKTEGGYSEAGEGAGGFSGDIELTAKLFGSNADSTSGSEKAGVIDGSITEIELWAFEDFGENPSSLGGVTVNLGGADIGQLGTFDGNVMIANKDMGEWAGIFSNTTITVDSGGTVSGVPEYVIGTYGFEHAEGKKERAFLGHFGLENR